METARRHSPCGWDASTWNDMIDLLFLTPEYRRMLQKIQVSWAKLMHTSARCCMPYAQRCHIEVIKFIFII